VLNIAQVYPARLRKSILDFRAEQYKLELYSTLILVFYLSYHFNGYSRFFYIFIFKTDYFPYFEITNTLGYLAILFRRYGSFFQVASNSLLLKTTALNRKTKHHRYMFPDSLFLLISFATH